MPSRSLTPVSHQVVSTWPIAPGEEASGMALDVAHHRLFLGCGGNQLMVMMDSASGKVLATVPIGPGVDATAFDPETQLAFSSYGEGNVTIAHERMRRTNSPWCRRCQTARRTDDGAGPQDPQDLSRGGGI